jgi:hypothetical protein
MSSSPTPTPKHRRSTVRAGFVCAVAFLLMITVARGAGEERIPEPVLGERETVTLLAGSVAVRLAGTSEFIPLTGTLSVPDSSEIDAREGRVGITVATSSPGATSGAEAFQGRFVLHQEPTPPAATTFTLSEALPGCVRRHRPKVKHSALLARELGGRRSRTRRLWVSDRGGSWGTNARYVSTTVEGTRWLTVDQCRKSKVKVAQGVVLVHDLIHHREVTVEAGEEYVAAKPERPGHVPPLGQVLSGETGVSPQVWERETGKSLSVFGYFGTWGRGVSSLLGYVSSLNARLLLHLSTDYGYGSNATEEISPGQIAAGESDRYLVQLCDELATSEQPVYIALLPEMNQANNAYSAFKPNGSTRGRSNSTASFRQAWRRSVLIIRGGSISSINRRLHRLHMPPLTVARGWLPSPEVSFMWAPQTAGTPDIAANSPAAYYPGSSYVDIVGTDFYSAFPNFRGLEALYAAYPSKPFGFNEWAMWQSGDPAFVRQLFGFVRSHRRTAMMVYNEGLTPNGPFRLTRFVAARKEIRHFLESPDFLAEAPE